MCSDAEPFKMVEHTGFKNLIHHLTNGKYSMPSRTYFSKTLIPGIYDKAKLEITSRIAEAKTYR